MSYWDRFIDQHKPELEKRLLRIIASEKMAIRKLRDIPKHDLGITQIEPCAEIVSVGALLRCCMCIESMLVLLRNGYYGSTNALLRQVYEFIVWCKLSIDNSEDSVLKKLHDDFYDDSVFGRADKLGQYYKHIRYELESDSTLTKGEIINRGRKLFSSFSYFTHATTISQQNAFKDEAFYENILLALHETGCWIVCLSYVIDAYLYKCRILWEPFEDMFN